MNRLYILYAACIAAVCADMLLVWWAKSYSHPLWSICTAIVLNILSLYVWSYSMRQGIESYRAITSYALFTVAGCSALGYYVFNESLSITNIIGLFLALVALIMINI